MTDPVRIWAPRAHHLDVVLGERRVAAERLAGGWWRGPVLEPGDEYALAADGGRPVPDPRSRWQPGGVHGPSRWIELEAPAFGFEAPPLGEAIIYELHVGTFSEGGTFASAIPHLDHLAELGVTHVELMPVAQFPGVHGWGYDGVDLYAVHEPYGGPAGLADLVRACHARGLAVVIDVVYNHFGPEGAYAPQLAPYLTDRHRTPWGPAVNLDGEGSDQVRRFLIDNAKMWLAIYGADGLRLDALDALFDTSPRPFVRELVDEIRALERTLGRRLVLIGEYDDHDPAAVREDGWALDAHWDDDFHHAMHALLAGEVAGYYGDFADRGTLAKVLTAGYALDGGISRFRGGPHGRPFGDLPRDRLVAYVQSHDQVGNRAAGERLHQLAGHARAKLAAALLLTAPFVPMLFMGEEWAASTPFCFFCDLGDAQLRPAVREGRRAEHASAGWDGEELDPLDPATRDRCVLRWAERDEGEHGDMLRWYRALVAARRTHPELRAAAPASTAVTVLDGGRGLRVDRGPFALVANFSERALAVEPGEVVLASGEVAGDELGPLGCALMRR